MVLSSLSDSELIRLYIGENEKAFEVLLKRYKNQVYKFIYLKVKDVDLANDIFQESFIKVVQNIKAGKYNEEGKFLPWATRIAQNLVIDYYRKQSKVRIFSERNSFNEDFGIFQRIACEDKNYLQQKSTEELEEQLVNLLHHLPKVQREIVQMRIFHDLSFKEIAESEKISINTALGRMRYALINLRKLLEENEIVTHFA
ncbi:MAG: sigma-70 family RNA polymerase sigma factor [Crocinitomicaceae bacterium]|nr:sigma-70 family RNA polymerase sigma factor [Crocinitomicaceae bacterium]MBP6032875.1 sigma-70 family RNA polymerase sigma factor [Crocinitomicaceae bacterium]